VVVASRRVLVGAFKASGGVARSMLFTEKRELMVQAHFDLPKSVIACLVSHFECPSLTYSGKRFASRRIH
jgi:hypothetical protein